MKKTNKLKKTLLAMLPLTVGMVFGFIIGFLLPIYINNLPEIGRRPYDIFIEIIGAVLVWYMHTIVHEGGHLIGGLLSGYTFSSFRIGSFMWVKEKGRLRLRRMSLAGTGGQCLMDPPDLKDGKVPFALYGMGGVIANAVFSLVLLIIHIFTIYIPIVRTVSVIGFLCGIVIAAVNGIPLGMGALVNDGANVLALIKEPSAVRSYWLQMKINEAVSNGVRVKDMPAEWFSVPSDSELKNHMHATIAVFACNRLMDEHRFAEAYLLMERLLLVGKGIIGLYRNLMTCDMIYCELVGENRRERIDKLYSKAHRNFMKSMKTNPSVIRTMYAYALIAENDPEKAYKISLEFDRHTIKYPYKNEIKAELELMRIAERAAQ